MFSNKGQSNYYNYYKESDGNQDEFHTPPPLSITPFVQGKKKFLYRDYEESISINTFP